MWRRIKILYRWKLYSYSFSYLKSSTILMKPANETINLWREWVGLRKNFFAKQKLDKVDEKASTINPPFIWYIYNILRYNVQRVFIRTYFIFILRISYWILSHVFQYWVCILGYSTYLTNLCFICLPNAEYKQCLAWSGKDTAISFIIALPKVFACCFFECKTIQATALWITFCGEIHASK